jgi:hypothetical protein
VPCGRGGPELELSDKEPPPELRGEFSGKAPLKHRHGTRQPIAAVAPARTTFALLVVTHRGR